MAISQDGSTGGSNFVQTFETSSAFLDLRTGILEIRSFREAVGLFYSPVRITRLVMSESFGLKATSRVDETDRFPFVKALALIAVADDSVDLDEKRLVQQYADAWSLNPDARAEVQDILRTQSSLSLRDLVAEFSESGTRFLLIQELMRLAHADGTYGEAERKRIAKIAHRMGMSEDQFREVEKWVGREQAWDGSGEEGDAPGADDLREVLDREDDPADSEHDLSDIETGDSDLSEIDTNLSEIDASEFEDEAPEDEESTGESGTN